MNTEDEERIRLAFKIVSREIGKNDREIKRLKHRQRRLEKLVLKGLRDFKKFFTVNLN